MTRIVFLTIILASAILAFVQAGPVPDPLKKNQEDKDEQAKLNESTLGKFENELERTWVNIKNMIDKNYNELLDDPTVSRSFLNNINEMVEEINKVNAGIIEDAREQVDNYLKPNDKAKTNVNNVKDYVLDSWNAFQDKLWKQYEQSMENPKVQAIIREVENAMRTSKDILEGIVDATRAQIDSERSENMDIEFEDDGLQKAQDAWTQLKMQFKEKYDKLMNNPKVKEITDNVDKAFEKSIESLKNIVNSIRKENVKDSISYSLEETQKPQVASFKERAEKVWKDLKNNVKQKRETIWSNLKVKEDAEKNEQAVEQVKKASNNVIENVCSEIDKISKFRESEDLEESLDRSSAKEKIEKAWNDFKTIITDKVDEIIRDPKTKDILDKSEKAVNNFQENIINMIKSIRKAAEDSMKDTDENSAKSAAATYVRNMTKAWNVFKKKITMTYKNVWNKEKVQTAVNDGERVLLRVQDNAQDIVNSIRKELEDRKINSL